MLLLFTLRVKLLALVLLHIPLLLLMVTDKRVKLQWVMHLAGSATGDSVTRSAKKTGERLPALLAGKTPAPAPAPYAGAQKEPGTRRGTGYGIDGRDASYSVCALPGFAVASVYCVGTGLKRAIEQGRATEGSGWDARSLTGRYAAGTRSPKNGTESALGTGGSKTRAADYSSRI
ncbi:hypothetical protein SUGI_1480340 [Cryptomeria japonica]|uniref:Uncharacterized protein n=1 Tax=Cryptomeria japonica TaxID=3369 RepID=A0AAD3NTR0_CRYJA|nr:hypothetical protein SUGI_1480340 [Cryptomeria japonica]